MQMCVGLYSSKFETQAFVKTRRSSSTLHHGKRPCHARENQHQPCQPTLHEDPGRCPGLVLSVIGWASCLPTFAFVFNWFPPKLAGI